MKYLSLKEVLSAHERAVRTLGGSHGTRDLALVESALARPRASFGDFEAYPDIFSKAAVLLEGLIKNHGFIDGNKRTATIVTISFLGRNGYKLDKDRLSGLVNFVVEIAEGKYDTEQIAAWLKKHTKKI